MTVRRWRESAPVPPVSRTVEKRDCNLCGRHGEVCLCEKEVTLLFLTEMHERARYARYREDGERVLAHLSKHPFLEGVSQCAHVTVNTAGAPTGPRGDGVVVSRALRGPVPLEGGHVALARRVSGALPRGRGTTDFSDEVNNALAYALTDENMRSVSARAPECRRISVPESCQTRPPTGAGRRAFFLRGRARDTEHGGRLLRLPSPLPIREAHLGPTGLANMQEMRGGGGLATDFSGLHGMLALDMESAGV